MQVAKHIFNNRIIIVSFLAWFVAQFLKVIFTYIFKGKFDLGRFIGSGGMPSSHSSFVVSLAMSVGFVEGFDTTIFALSLAFAIIVMYDAAGVRRATGKQATVLNEIVDEIYKHRVIPEEKLKELIGHTPFEVIVGALIGLLISKLFF